MSVAVSVAQDGAAAGDAASSTSPASADGAVTESITLDNANAMMAAGDAFISSTAEQVVHLDMQHVEASSVAVAVALSWLAGARREGKELALSNLSSDFNGVIEFSDFRSMFADHISVVS